MIPKILHLTNKVLSGTHEFILNEWSRLNPEFEIRFYNDKINENFIRNYFSQYYDIFDKIPNTISKIDFIRLLYLYKFGGVYVDCDVLPLKSIDTLLNISEIVLFKENGKYFNQDYIISNAVIFATPNHTFIKKLIDEIILNVENLNSNWNDIRQIIELSGPLLFHKCYNEYENKNQIMLLDEKYFNPMTHYELKSGFISEDIGYSYGVHLFEGSWWTNNQYSDNLIENIINKHNHQVTGLEFPLISCLCITKNDPTLVNIAIDCFEKQIYPNKELIVVFEEDNKDIDYLIGKYKKSNINFFKIDINPKKTLGELRNISIDFSNGEYISQWDDDDWHSPIRLWEQFYYMKKHNKNGSILRTWLVYDERNNQLYERERTDLIGWEGSILFKKSEIKNLYESLTKGEDTEFIRQLENQIFPINLPELYLYRIHYNNTWEYEKLKTDIIEPGKIYSDQSFICRAKRNITKKILCFTTSYKRLKMLRGCIMDIKNQTYNNIHHAINITEDNNVDQKLFLKAFDDLTSDKCFISFTINQNQHINHMNAIFSVANIDDYDIFVKIDDDDIYKTNYIQNIVDVFDNNNVDIVSSKVTTQLNNNGVYSIEQHNLGGNPNGCDFKIPATFAFNRKALDLISKIDSYTGFEDNIWREIWCGKCKIQEVDNTNEYIWHIHGSNVSTKDFLIK